ncbi:MAG: sigma-54-dependent Fis family transcriptional regulator, partial [Candidatus Obscuribacterales bacterium]|nr:sigma-54-dependent Fis family transcriptional regulator [Steroidobacteraceae bacterium]
INCGAIPDNLIESELFGHERGAFTDAKEARHGVIAQAEGGTLFLDEVDALSTKAQVTLLRFLQDRQYRPLGSNRMRTADTRIVAATNANLQYQVEQGRFRADLMFRLNILSLHLPPLRERSGDVALLAQYFVDLLSARYRRPTTRIDVAMLAWLESQAWPGNVRELESAIHRKLLMAEPGDVITFDGALLESSADEAARSSDWHFRTGKQQIICEFERSALSKALRQQGGNVTRAAKQVGKERRAFGKLLKKHNIVVESYRRP